MDGLKKLYTDMDELETTLGIVTELGHLTPEECLKLDIRVRNLIDSLNEIQARSATDGK
jgi:hypothetical protein